MSNAAINYLIQEQINKLCQKYKIPYFEVSAKSNINIDLAFDKLLSIILKNNSTADTDKLICKIRSDSFTGKQMKKRDQCC